MNKLLTILILCATTTASAYTLKTDFLRVAKTYENAQFPLDMTGYLDLSFRVTIEDDSNPEGLLASIERRMDGDVVSSHTRYFAYGKEEWVEFPDGNKGPKLTFEKPLKKGPDSEQKKATP